MAENSGASSSRHVPEVIEIRDDEPTYCEAPPPPKIRKSRRTSTPKLDRLESRLGDILCCAVCLELPKFAVYQCSNGHLMCAGCFCHVLADARLRDEIATCPNCRVEISRNLASRNLAVEKAVSELPSQCQYCGDEYPRNSLDYHEEYLCPGRTTSCRFCRIGCSWTGPYRDREQHEILCTHPHRSGEDIIEALQIIDQKLFEEKNMYDSIFDLLSYEKIVFNDLQLKPYRTDEFVHKLFYETSRFAAFNNQWVVKARINNSQRDPTLSCERILTYQLALKTKTNQPLSINFLILRGPFGDMKVSPKIYRFDFSDQDSESPYVVLPLIDTAECNRMLSAKAINFRLIMFWIYK